MSTMNRFDGKVAVITGGAGGIGSATARVMAREGAKVVVADINGQAAETVAADLRADGASAVPATVDVEHEDQIVAMLEIARREFGGVDVLHNNAALQTPEAIGGDLLVQDIDADRWDQAFRVNLRGYMLGAKHAIPSMLERGGGVIINTASGTGLQAELARPTYGTSKAAIIGFTRNVATQYGKQGIRCCAVAPGLVATPALRANMPPEVLERFLRHFLTPYIAEPEDIANAVAFLASDDARFITGITLPVDGGFSVHTPSYADEMEMMGG
jgi:NAD(P)-dependent dehydrogenase (short-subunit alcohol dehydrogenase family)